jgi:hypothetical protein
VIYTIKKCKSWLVHDKREAGCINNIERVLFVLQDDPERTSSVYRGDYYLTGLKKKKIKSNKQTNKQIILFFAMNKTRILFKIFACLLQN